VFGVAVLGAVFSARGGYTSGAAFVTGLSSAIWVGGAVVAVAAAVTLALPRLRRVGATATTDAAATRGAAPAEAALATDAATTRAAATAEAVLATDAASEAAVAGPAAGAATAEAEPVPALAPVR